MPIAGSSEIEFASSEDAERGADPQREIYATKEGLVSLRELAEEELLLALPIVAVCDSPQSCGRAPSYVTGGEMPPRDAAICAGRLPVCRIC